MTQAQAFLAGQVQRQTLPMASTQGSPANFFQHPAPLGSNLYDRDRVRVIPPEGRQRKMGNQPASAPSSSAVAEPNTVQKETISHMRGAMMLCVMLQCCV